MPFDGTTHTVTTSTQILIDARALLDRKWGWCRKTLRSGRAHCSIGAIYTAAGEFYSQDVMPSMAVCVAFGRLRKVIGRNDIDIWNDEQRYKYPVLAAFDRAIAIG